MINLVQTIPSAIDSNTAVSVGLLLVIISAVIKLNSMLKDITNELKNHAKTPEKVEKIEKTLMRTDHRIETLESDVNNLWAFARTDDPAKLFDNMRSRPRNKHDDE
jgi:cell fate (sporulation/competence/biofilm development) regulator YmcA (YheA/YmcA/DUF963 family)